MQWRGDCVKAVVVTGAERCVGKDIVKCLLEENYHLIAVSISMSELDKMKKEMATYRTVGRED
jgi:short-subunit dehydrogenase